MIHNPSEKPAYITGIANNIYRVTQEDGSVDYVAAEDLTNKQLKELPELARKMAEQDRQISSIPPIFEQNPRAGDPAVILEQIPGKQNPIILEQNPRAGDPAIILEQNPLEGDDYTIFEQDPSASSNQGTKNFPRASSSAPTKSAEGLEWNQCFQILESALISKELIQAGFQLALDENARGTGVQLEGPDDIRIAFDHEGNCMHNLEANELEALLAVSNLSLQNEQNFIQPQETLEIGGLG